MRIGSFAHEELLNVYLSNIVIFGIMSNMDALALESDKNRLREEGISFNMDDWDVIRGMDKFLNPLNLERSEMDLDEWAVEKSEAAAAKVRREFKNILQNHLQGGRILLDGLGDELTQCVDACEPGPARQTAQIIAEQLTTRLAMNYEEDLQHSVSERVWLLLGDEALEQETETLFRHRKATAEDLTSDHIRKYLTRTFGLPWASSKQDEEV